MSRDVWSKQLRIAGDDSMTVADALEGDLPAAQRSWTCDKELIAELEHHVARTSSQLVRLSVELDWLKDVPMTQAAATCVVCHYPRADGSFSDNGEFFICSECQADANQFLEIQDDIWPPTTNTHAASEKSDDRSDP